MMNRNLITRILQIALVMVILVAALIVAVRYQTVTVPVLNTPAKPGDIIQSSQISYVSMPAGAVFNGLVVNAPQVVGQQASVNVAANQPLKTEEFVPSGTKIVPRLDSDFPYATAEDLPKIRYSLLTDLLHSAGGSLLVGDYVNIQHRWGDKTSTHAQFILQKVHIIGAADKIGTSLSYVPTGTANAPKSNTIAYWYIALTQAQADQFGQIPWGEIYLFKTDLSKPLLSYGGQTVEVASTGSANSAPGPTPGPLPTPTAAPASPTPKSGLSPLPSSALPSSGASTKPSVPPVATPQPTIPPTATPKPS
jgi:hypothetical protein